MTRRIVLHIDRLVLRGFDAADGEAIAGALRVELGRQLAGAQGAGQWPASAVSLRLGRINVGQGVRPEQVGTQLGRTIGRGVKA